jgi:hypothetical protein
MGPIGKAVLEFQEKRLAVYLSDSDQIIRDTRSAERASKDHVGRWFFELLQNCDDAKATEVLVRVENNAVYVADNGYGLQPRAVRAICGTDFSDKTSGTIGRKGVGFKSVYDISLTPQVLTLNGDGIEFNPNKTVDWLKEHQLDYQYVPFHWIPFLITWDTARKFDPILDSFNEYVTIVKLPFMSGNNIQEKIQKILEEWPFSTLFTFRKVEKILTPYFEVSIKKNGNIWEITDSRKNLPEQWQVKNPVEHVKDKRLLENIGKVEREAIEEDGVSFLIASPLENGSVIPTDNYFPIHVFYPTQEIGPVRLLLHAEFLVKSDRTMLISIKGNKFQEWVVTQLSKYICDFVQNMYSTENPSSHLLLLLPFGDKRSHPVADILFNNIVIEAEERLRLGNLEGIPCLKISAATYISNIVRPDIARQILVSTEYRDKLLHHKFDGNKEAIEVLSALGCSKITTQILINIIVNDLPQKASDHEWVFACWRWLAEWVAEKPWGLESKERIEKIKELPIIPVKGQLHRLTDFGESIVSWQEQKKERTVPSWVPLVFIDSWLKDKIDILDDGTTEKKAVENVVNKLNIHEISEETYLQSIEQAIKKYWEEHTGCPEDFFKFILSQNWHETFYGTQHSELRKCPVKVRLQDSSEKWIEAHNAYFGIEWGNDLLENLYGQCTDVPWVLPIESVDSNLQKNVLQWLGVSIKPRIITAKKDVHIYELVDDYKNWKEYLLQKRDTDGRAVTKVSDIDELEHVSIEHLDSNQTVALLRLFARNWNYYGSHTQIDVFGRSGLERNYRVWKADSFWWHEVRNKIVPPLHNQEKASLSKCWLPDRQTFNEIGNLLPVIKTAEFKEDEDCVRQWLHNEVKIKTNIEQMTENEWKILFSEKIPNWFPDAQMDIKEQLPTRISRWYVLCLDNLCDNKQLIEKFFESCPILCRKSNDWKYINNTEERYLEDNTDYGNAFREEIWLAKLPTHYGSKEKIYKYFGIPALSEVVKIEEHHLSGLEKALEDEIYHSFINTLPFIYAERCFHDKEYRRNPEKLKSRLQKLMVMTTTDKIQSRINLNNIIKQIPRHFVVEHGNNRIILQKNSWGNYIVFAQALAEYLGNKEYDFYENMIRCNSDEEREDKLRAKGLIDADIALVQEFYGDNREFVPNNSSYKEDNSDSQQNSNGKTLTNGSGQSDKDTHDASNGQSTEEINIVELNLVDANTIDYEVGTLVKDSDGGGGFGQGHTGTKNVVLPTLSQEQKIEIEKCGRLIVKRRLQEKGYKVIEMALDNPGFDLKAVKDEERELRIEVKAHRGKANTIELTTREYKEYIESKNGSYNWQLFNVEYLDETVSSGAKVTVTPYINIPDYALDAKTFRVDLKQCS